MKKKLGRNKKKIGEKSKKEEGEEMEKRKVGKCKK